MDPNKWEVTTYLDLYSPSLEETKEIWGTLRHVTHHCSNPFDTCGWFIPNRDPNLLRCHKDPISRCHRRGSIDQTNEGGIFIDFYKEVPSYGLKYHFPICVA